MGNLSAILFVFIAFGTLNLSPTLRSQPRMLAIASLAVAAHHGAAFVNAFITPLSSSWGDLYHFHNLGCGLPGRPIPYGNFLWVMYKIFGASFWLGSEISVVVFALATVVLVELLKELGYEKLLAAPLLLFGFLPSALLHCSATMREPYQMLAYLSCLLALVKLRRGAGLVYINVLFLGLLVMVLMHQGLAAFAAMVFMVGAPWALQGRGKIGSIAAVLVLLLLPLVMPKVSSLLESDSPTVRAFNEGRLLEYTANYREGVLEARSDYGVKIETGSLDEFIGTTAVVVLMYFLAPLPWQVVSAMDFYAFFEVLLRLALFYGAAQNYARASAEQRSSILVVLSFSMVLEFMWALGTTNWGTSIRHHLVAFGPFVVVGSPYWSNFTLDAEMRALLRRRERRKALQAGVSS